MLVYRAGRQPAGDGQTLVARSATAGDAEQVNVSDAPGTRFFVRVWADPQVGNAYELQVTIEDTASGIARASEAALTIPEEG